MLKSNAKVYLAAGALALSLIGCESKSPQSLSSINFYAPERHDSELVNHDASNPESKPAASEPASRAVAKASPSTIPANPISLGQYMTLGGVVAEVNGTPIYANKVLASIASVLRAYALQMDEREFRAAANQEILKQIVLMEREETEIATAQHNLDDKEKGFADRLTQQWRKEQITLAGGSVELARRNAPEIARNNRLPEDMSFEDLVHEQYRKYLTIVYYRRKIIPRIPVSADDVREYYSHNLDTVFTEHSKVRFRLIKIDPAVRGDGAKAFTIIEGLRKRVTDGKEDFSKVAAKINDDPLLLRRSGQVDWIEKGAYVYRKIEEALWATDQGAVTPIIEDDGGLYLAKVEEKTLGKVREFDDPKLQDEIAEAIKSSQLGSLRTIALQKLEKDRVTRDFQTDPHMADSALDLAMQMYAQSRAQAAANQQIPASPVTQ